MYKIHVISIDLFELRVRSCSAHCALSFHRWFGFFAAISCIGLTANIRWRNCGKLENKEIVVTDTDENGWKNRVLSKLMIWLLAVLLSSIRLYTFSFCLHYNTNVLCAVGWSPQKSVYNLQLWVGKTHMDLENCHNRKHRQQNRNIG